MGKLYVISGSSGVGKGTVIKAFLEKHNKFRLSVSCTTRTIRAGEVDGVNYFFMSKEEFKTCVNNNEFLEWAEFSGNYYGTNKNFVKENLSNGNSVLLESSCSILPVGNAFPYLDHALLLCIRCRFKVGGIDAIISPDLIRIYLKRAEFLECLFHVSSLFV